MLKPRGQTSLEAKNLASASSFWPRPRPRPRNSLASASRHSGHYRMSPQLPEPGTDEPSKQLLRYITYINSITSDHSLSELTKLYYDFSVLQSLFDRLFSCIPASSAPVKRVFSQSGVIMTARRERISNAVLESPVFLKCNADI